MNNSFGNIDKHKDNDFTWVTFETKKITQLKEEAYSAAFGNSAATVVNKIAKTFDNMLIDFFKQVIPEELNSNTAEGYLRNLKLLYRLEIIIINQLPYFPEARFYKIGEDPNNLDNLMTMAETLKYINSMRGVDD